MLAGVSFAAMGIVIAIACMVSHIVTTAIRAKHGYPIENDFGGTVRQSDGRATELLAAQNERLEAMVCRLEERLSVLERIATDQPSRLSAEIERLR
jgi:hypothetical protein